VTSPTSVKGQRAEQQTVLFLQEQGYRIIQRNYRCRVGEIDLIAEDGAVLCFIEVRSRRSDAFGDPLETIDRAKQRRIIRAARLFLASGRHGDREVRFDVVGIVYEPELRIRLIKGAFE
jgi:putative endonuclease